MEWHESSEAPVRARKLIGSGRIALPLDTWKSSGGTGCPHYEHGMFGNLARFHRFLALRRVPTRIVGICFIRSSLLNGGN